MGGACRLPAVAVLGISLALGLSACGGDNDPANEPPTTSPPDPAETKPLSAKAKAFPADLKQKVDPICVKAKKQVDKIAGTQVRDRPSLQKLAGVYEGAAKDLEAVTPPEQNAVAYKRFTKSFHDANDLFTRLDAEVGRGDSSAYQRVPTTLDGVNTDIKDQAQQYGLTGCGSD